jgi:short-subunit dehydrogenase
LERKDYIKILVFENMEIKGKIVIVTGASQGIGLATAKLLSEKGAKIILAARSEDLIKNLEKELPGSVAIKTDVTKEEDVKNLIRKTINKFGRIDILINVAGQGIHGLSVEKTDIENYKKVMDLNVFSVVRLMQEVIPHMREQGGGMIINVSSMLSKMYIPNIAQYSSTKYALNSISLTARQELAKDKIIVSIVLPKMTKTNFMKNSLGPQTQWTPNPNAPPMQIDTAEKVAEKILETIRTEEAEAIV